jgi:hypothetical protein
MLQHPDNRHAAAIAHATEFLSALKPLRGAPTHVIAIWQLADAVKRKLDMPDKVVDVLVRVAIGKRNKRGGDANRNRGRNIAICATIESVHLEFDYDFTRNEASDGPSACSIVAEALNHIGENLSESAVVKIWSRGPHISHAGPDGAPVRQQ